MVMVIANLLKDIDEKTVLKRQKTRKSDGKSKNSLSPCPTSERVARLV